MATDKNSKTMREKTPKTRSPNYPGIPLDRAIARAKEVFGKVRRHSTGMGVLARCWELSEKSSTFMVQLAALRAFGLLENVANQGDKLFKLTALALDIVADYPEGSASWKSAVQHAALAPGIHAILREKYGPSLPDDDEVRRFLVREKRFNDRVVADFIGEYKVTMDFAKLGEGDKMPPADPEKSWSVPSWGNGGSEMKTKTQEPVPPSPTEHRMRDLPVTLPGSLEIAVFRFPVPMSESDYKTLVASLAAMKDTLVAADKEKK